MSNINDFIRMNGGMTGMFPNFPGVNGQYVSPDYPRSMQQPTPVQPAPAPQPTPEPVKTGDLGVNMNALFGAVGPEPEPVKKEEPKRDSVTGRFVKQNEKFGELFNNVNTNNPTSWNYGDLPQQPVYYGNPFFANAYMPDPAYCNGFGFNQFTPPPVQPVQPEPVRTSNRMEDTMIPMDDENKQIMGLVPVMAIDVDYFPTGTPVKVKIHRTNEQKVQPTGIGSMFGQKPVYILTDPRFQKEFFGVVKIADNSTLIVSTVDEKGNPLEGYVKVNDLVHKSIEVVRMDKIKETTEIVNVPATVTNVNM